ncbi:hypothetical protein [Moraxella lacunata]|uniref:hypothetical protein n=1 Tax=Moraxella lacunata TaxID=477 RepID=UPI003EDFB503
MAIWNKLCQKYSMTLIIGLVAHLKKLKNQPVVAVLCLLIRFVLIIMPKRPL